MKTRKELIAQRDPKSPISEVFRTLRQIYNLWIQARK